ncbi:hypothetical protein [Pseudonocardia spinosispora]|uniref:hypothetical protein n=1 Tax=Pseudonocardia spinosispora TaxID=103441 RepID=UPI00041152F6|nr:hypothetical protein [Pseudonocardia spinosispora]
MSATGKQIAAALDRGRKPVQLAVAAHEMGHAIGILANGERPGSVRLKFGIFGGFTGGWCDYGGYPDRDWPSEKKLGRLVAMMAGHAAETRFCQLYLDMDYRAAFKYGRGSSDGDYQDFRHWRGKLGVRWKASEDWAFDQATRLIERRADYLDRYTLRLERTRYLDGGDL